MRCDTCRRTLGKEMLSCPRRKPGEDGICQFRVEHRKVPAADWGWFLFLGLGVALIPVIAYLTGDGLPMWIKVVFTPLLILGAFGVAGAVYRLFGTQTLLYNPVTGQTWQQTTLFGISVSELTFGKIEAVPWLGAPARVMRYPASVTSLYRQDGVSDIVSTALLQLIAQGVLELGQVCESNRLKQKKLMYVLRPGANFGAAEVHGRLENRLVEILSLAGSEEEDFSYNGKAYPRSYRAALCLEDALQIAFEGGQSNPNNYLVTQVVGPEAEELGLGSIRGERNKKLGAAKNTLGKISLDIRTIDQLHRDFWTTAPEHAREVLARIDLFIVTEIPIKGASLEKR